MATIPTLKFKPAGDELWRKRATFGAAVLVLTPAIGLLPDDTSSTYTPGAKYSGIFISFYELSVILAMMRIYVSLIL